MAAKIGSKREKVQDWTILGIVIFVAVFLAIFVARVCFTPPPAAVADNGDGRITPYIEGDELPPFKDVGEELSWRRWGLWATSEWYEGRTGAWLAMKELNEFSDWQQAFNAIEWQVENEDKGKNYLVSVTQNDGRWIWNTGPKGERYTIGQTWLSYGFPYLAWDPANPYLPRTVQMGVTDVAVKGDCFNPARDILPKEKVAPVVPSAEVCPPAPAKTKTVKPKPSVPRPTPKPCPPPVPKPEKPLRNDDPSGRLTPHHPNNDAYYYPPDPGRTPGANSPDVIEEVIKEQEKSFPGNRESTPKGTDSGTTTNPTNSQTTNPDGSTTESTIGSEVENNPPNQNVVPSDSQSGFDPYAIP